jgi:hypothetical protein
VEPICVRFPTDESIGELRHASAANMSVTNTVGVSSQSRSRATTWVANTESPPREKKSSSMPILSLATPRTSATIATNADHPGTPAPVFGSTLGRHGGYGVAPIPRLEALAP